LWLIIIEFLSATGFIPNVTNKHQNENLELIIINLKKKMYSEKLEKLIEMALLDGELTEKEKQILFRNAEKEGIDLDEFEMVLEGRLFEKQKNNQPEKIKSEPKSDKYGNVKKCPSCGSIVQAFNTKCIDCDYEFRNIQNINSIQDFFNDYQKIEQSIKLDENIKKTGGLVGLIIGDDSEEHRENRIREKQKQVFLKKKEFIMHFPIPNSKEDLLEFLMMAVPIARPAKKNLFGFMKNVASNFDDNWNHKIAMVWMQKCEQIIMKSRFSMKDNKEVLAKIDQYAKELKIK